MIPHPDDIRPPSDIARALLDAVDVLRNSGIAVALEVHSDDPPQYRLTLVPVTDTPAAHALLLDAVRQALTYEQQQASTTVAILAAQRIA